MNALLAGRGKRLLAQILDGLCLVLILVLSQILTALMAPSLFKNLFHDTNIGNSTTDVAATVAKLASVTFIISFIAFFVLFIIQTIMLAKYGQTIGKKMLGIKIVDEKTAQTNGFFENVFLRAWVNSLLCWIPIYALLDILFIFGGSKRCLHDLMAGTCVIEDGTEILPQSHQALASNEKVEYICKAQRIDAQMSKFRPQTPPESNTEIPQPIQPGDAQKNTQQDPDPVIEEESLQVISKSLYNRQKTTRIVLVILLLLSVAANIFLGYTALPVLLKGNGLLGEKLNRRSDKTGSSESDKSNTGTESDRVSLD
jgi:uncharacterized RDD family membrane protein YckC